MKEDCTVFLGIIAVLVVQAFYLTIGILEIGYGKGPDTLVSTKRHHFL